MRFISQGDLACLGTPRQWVSWLLVMRFRQLISFPIFIPVLGYLDDLILVPLGTLLAIQLIPSAIMAEHRRSAVAAQVRPRSRVAAATIVGIWIASVTICGLLVFYHFQ